MPLIGTQLAQMALNVTDTVMVGWLGATELAAAVLGTQIFFTVYIFGSGFAIAVMPVAAAAEGRGIALASTYLVEKDLVEGNLVELVLPDSRQAVIGGYAFVTREDRWNSPAIVKLRHFLQRKAT